MAEKFEELLEMYRRLFLMVDAFHFNSQNTADVYRRYLEIPEKSKVIPITHSDIDDHRKQRKYDERVLTLGFIGSEAPFKGLPMLKDVIGKLNEAGYKERVRLNVYGGRVGLDDSLNNVFYKGKFASSKMAHVFDDMDILVVPSICYETFSFVTLEALSFGTVVIVSDKVGAKDLVRRYAPEFIFDTKDDLLSMLNLLVIDRTSLKKYQENLLKDDWKYSIQEHSRMIVEQLYKRV